MIEYLLSHWYLQPLFQTLAFKGSARFEMDMGSWDCTCSSLAVSVVVLIRHPKPELHILSQLHFKIHNKGSLPGLPNLLGSTVKILITPLTCIYTEFLKTGWVPSWDEINSQFLHETEHYSLPGSEKLIVGELVQSSHSSPAACDKGRVLWGVFTRCTPEHLPACRLARLGGWVAIHGITELLRLKRTSKILESNC